MKLQSFGKKNYGYGDIVMPLCFAQNQGEILQTTVDLKFRWEFGSTEQDTPMDFAEVIHNKFKFPNVRIHHEFNCVPEVDVDLNLVLKKPDEIDKFHILYFPVEKTTELYDVVCSPLNNKTPFAPKAWWKQGLSDDVWRKFIERPNTKHVDYRVTTEEAIDILMNCRMFIGYHGSCTWLARLVGAPMKVFSGQPRLSRYCFPWNDYDYNESKEKLIECKKERDEFIKQRREIYYDSSRGIQTLHSDQKPFLD